MFDREHWTASLRKTCPTIRVYDDIQDLKSNVKVKKLLIMKGNTLGKGKTGAFRVKDPEHWRAAFDSWLAKLSSRPPSSSFPIMIAVPDAAFEWPTAPYESPSFMKAFGRILQLQKEARELAAIVLYELSLTLKDGKEINPALGITKNSFYGAHLLTAKDATAVGWPGYDIQADTYLKNAADRLLDVIYVASGNPDEVQTFKDKAWTDHNISVTSKDRLLKGNDLERLNNLTWDQQDLVDYEVMLKSSAFGGMEYSSFAVNVALRRHMLAEDVNQGLGEVGSPGQPSFIISDDFSRILGDPTRPDQLYMSTWP